MVYLFMYFYLFMAWNLQYCTKDSLSPLVWAADCFLPIMMAAPATVKMAAADTTVVVGNSFLFSISN